MKSVISYLLIYAKLSVSRYTKRCKHIFYDRFKFYDRLKNVSIKRLDVLNNTVLNNFLRYLKGIKFRGYLISRLQKFYFSLLFNFLGIDFVFFFW